MSIKDRMLFQDIEWLMPHVDCRLTLVRLGCHPDTISRRKNEIWTLCPDHHLFVNRRSSHPKWSVNIKTGKCKCLTEGRGSNLVYVVSRLRNCSPRDAAAWMTAKDGADADLSNLQVEHRWGLKNDIRTDEEGKDKRKSVDGLHDIYEEVDKSNVFDTGKEFFMRPPGKKPTLIVPETLEHYSVFERKWGFYRDRVIIPFFLRGDIIGFCAIDTLGEAEWKRQNPHKEYKKILFPRNCPVGEYVFGFDDVKPGCDRLLVVEGPREVMKLWQLGYSAVALLGTNLGGGQLLLLAELSPKSIWVMLDGDDAGRDATRKIAMALVHHFETYEVPTADGFDPKSMSPKQLKMSFRDAKRTKGS